MGLPPGAISVPENLSQWAHYHSSGWIDEALNREEHAEWACLHTVHPRLPFWAHHHARGTFREMPFPNFWKFILNRKLESLHHSLRVLMLSGEILLLPGLGDCSADSRQGKTDPQVRSKRTTHSTFIQRQNAIHTNCWVRRATSWERFQKSVGSPCLWGLSHFFPSNFSAAKKYHCHTPQPFLKLPQIIRVDSQTGNLGPKL